MANEDSKVISINEILTNLTKFQYEKAKACIDKSKDMPNKIWSLFQNVFSHLINGEKFYNNLQFLNQKAISKIGDKSYESAIACLEQIARELNTKPNDSTAPSTDYRIRTSSSFDTISLNSSTQAHTSSGYELATNINEFIEQLVQFIEFRVQMMQFYFEMRERELNRPEKLNLSASLSQLTESKFNQMFSHVLMEPLVSIQTLEVSLIKSLLQCHQAIEIDFDCIKSIVCLKQINDVFNNQLPLLNSKQSKESKGFSLFSRSSSQQRLMPLLYQWFKMYYQILLNKFSVIMHSSFLMISDVDHIMIEKNELYNKLLVFIKKFVPSLTGLVLDTNKIQLSNFRGAGYEMLFSNETTNDFHVVFVYPSDHLMLKKHTKNLATLTNSEFDQRSKYHFDQNLKSSYYLCKIAKQTDVYTFFMTFEQNKQENKTKTASFVQEICDDLNTTKVFEIFNSNLK